MIWIVVPLLPVAIYGGLVAVKGRKGALETLFGKIEREPVRFETLEPASTPNQYLVCPPGLCSATAHAVSPEFDRPVEEVRDAWLALAESEPNVELLESDRDLEQYEFEALTPLVNFPDTVTVRFLPLGDGRSTLAIYSRSHYGQSDLGANRKRIKRWLASLEERLAAEVRGA